MAFESMYLEEDIHIDRIYTIHYFEYKSDFHFAGEYSGSVVKTKI